MNNQFKSEFKNLKPNEIKDIINGCAGHDILRSKLIEKNKYDSNDGVYFIKYIEDDNYGFWNIEWGWKQIYYLNMATGSGYFLNRIKITPFKIEVESLDKSLNPYSKPNTRKHLEEYLQVYINRKCPNYKQAIVEEVEKFFKMLDYGENENE